MLKMKSNSPDNLQNLSKEELLKMVQLLQSDNASLGDKVEQAETVKAKALEEKVQAEKAKAKEERALAEANKVKFQVESELNAVKTCIEENILTMAEIAKSCNKRIFIVDDVLSAKIAEQVEFIFKESNEWMLLAKAWLGQTAMGKKGSDVKRTNNSITKATEEVKGQKVATSLNNIKTGTTRIEKALVEVASNLKEEGSLSEKSFKKLVELGLNRKLTPAKKPSIGRVAKNRKTSAVKTGKVLNHICKICGGATKPLTDFDCSHYSQNLIQMASLAQTLAADVQNNYDLEYCTKCGQIKVVTKLTQDLSVVLLLLSNNDQNFLTNSVTRYPINFVHYILGSNIYKLSFDHIPTEKAA